MKSKYILYALIALLTLNYACNDKSNLNSTIQSYQLKSGIYVEQFDSTNNDDSRYNYDNKIFKEGSTYLYSYHHIDKAGDTLFFEVPEREQMYQAPWNFTETSNADAINTVEISVLKGLGFMGKQYPDYYQTVVMYKYFKSDEQLDFNSISGIIENEKNLWAHPPRDYYFKILELNPFPFVQYPLEKGESWNWSLKIGDKWSDDRWKTWEGVIENDYQYEVMTDTTINSALGSLTCKVIAAKATSRLGTTQLTSYFHPSYGFLKLDYTNIDGSKTIMELVEMNN